MVRLNLSIQTRVHVLADRRRVGLVGRLVSQRGVFFFRGSRETCQPHVYLNLILVCILLMELCMVGGRNALNRCVSNPTFWTLIFSSSKKGFFSDFGQCQFHQPHQLAVSDFLNFMVDCWEIKKFDFKNWMSIIWYRRNFLTGFAMGKFVCV
jgi:hypothetical protein